MYLIVAVYLGIARKGRHRNAAAGPARRVLLPIWNGFAASCRLPLRRLPRRRPLRQESPPPPLLLQPRREQ